jgi:Fuc2NAc and GlcNAc transferase
MSLVEIAVVAFVALVSGLFTGVIRRLAIAQDLYDTPNPRSSHTIPTPRGGGAAIALVSIAGFLVAASIGRVDARLLIALTVGGAVVAVVGFLDDRFGLSAGLRLAVHLAAAFLAVGCLGGVPPVRFGGHVIELGVLGYFVGALAIVWTLNLFNFMDGIDGIAASEAIFVAVGGVLLTAVTHHTYSVSSVALVFAAACCGFLAWNWPPAKIFMGDVGSGFLGYILGVLPLAAMRNDSSAVWSWLILSGVFFVDATLTLARRALRGERVQEAHRSHAYQWLARRWGSHKRVTVLVLFINVLWLLPCALLAARYPGRSQWIALGALLPIVGLALAAGAGRLEYRAGSEPAA